MINKAPTPQEARPNEAEAQAAKRLEAFTDTPLEFTGDFDKDIEITQEWMYRLDDAFFAHPLPADRETIYQHALDFLEKQDWKYRLTTSKGSRYFITESGVVIRAKAATEHPSMRIKQPTRLLGFGTDKFLRAYEQFFFAFQAAHTEHLLEQDFRHRHEDRYIDFLYVHDRESQDQTVLTLSRLSPEPRKGLRPIDVKHVGFCKGVEFDAEGGTVKLVYAPNTSPAIHPGHKIKKIDR